MDIIIIAFFIIIISGIKYKHNGEYDDYISRDSTMPIRGIFAIAIILHHLSQRTSGGYIFSYLSYCGFINVSVFFALSGYGLIYQYDSKGNSYLENFIPKRFCSILIPYVIINIVYFFLRNSLNITTTVKDILLGLVNGSPIMSFSWYVIALCYFYILFFISCKLFKKRTYFISSIFFGTCFYCISCYLLGYKTWWFNSIFAFCFGIVFFIYNRNDRFRLKKINISTKLAVVLLLLHVSFSLSHTLNIKVLKLFFQEISSCLFPLFSLLLCKKLKFNNKILDWLGTRSYEIYLTQEIPMLLLRNQERILIENDFIYSILVILISILSVAILYKIDRFLIAKHRLYFCTKKVAKNSIKTTV